jgi:hypothetical protein
MWGTRTSWRSGAQDARTDADGSGTRIDTAPEHYCCYRVYVTSTRAERHSATVQFFPHECAMPKTSSADNALRVATALVDVLKYPAPAAPFATLGQAQLHALDQLATIFASVTAPPVVPALAPRAPLRQSAPSPRVTAVPAIIPSPVAVTRVRTPVAPPRVPNLFEPNPDDPVLHRYRLRSHTNFASESRYRLATRHLVTTCWRMSFHGFSRISQKENLVDSRHLKSVRLQQQHEEIIF